MAILGLLDAKREYRDERAKSWTIEPVSEVKRLDESRKHWHQYFYSSRLNTKYCGYTSTADAFRRGKVFLRQARYLKYGLVVLVAFEPSEMAVHE